MQRALASFVVVVVLIVSLIGQLGVSEARSTLSDHLVLGNPSGAVSSTSAETNYLIQREEYALSYHRYRGIPNWVSWHLDTGDFGDAPRSTSFLSDSSLPSGWYRVSSSDYTNSGYDRGHMTPSADRTSSSEANQNTFIMTNILPQAPDNNQGPWVDLESYTRQLVNQGNEAYIISGGSGSKATIDGGNVTVPEWTWKIVVILPEGSNDAARVSTSTRVIAINMPNIQGIRYNDWTQYLTTVDTLEQQTGYDFLSHVDPNVQAVVEARVDGDPIPEPTPTPGTDPTATPEPTPGTEPQPTPQPTPEPTPAPGGCPTNLLISEYIEGSSYNKALELYNGTNNTINLSGYSIQIFTNGASSASTNIDLSGSVASGGVYVITHSSATKKLRNKADLRAGGLNFNGNDAVALVYNGSFVDVIGDIGYDPGSVGWGSGSVTTTGTTLVRMDTIVTGDSNGYDNFYPQEQWNGYGSDYFNLLGFHSLTCQ